MELKNTLDLYRKIRKKTLKLCKNLEIEDYVIQSIDDVSPIKWHLAHTSWFFEQFILKQHIKDYKFYNSEFLYIFNSYYNSFGKFFCRGKRGTLSRPTLREIKNYREHVDKNMENLLKSNLENVWKTTEIGLNHEEQHQELLLSDIKCNFFYNPLKPKYYDQPKPTSFNIKFEYIDVYGGLVDIGSNNSSFHYDNESPQHKYFLKDYQIMSRPVSNGEYLEFILDGGYQNFKFWFSDGWKWVNSNKIEHPMYWEKKDEQWFEFSLYGLNPLDKNDFLSHITFYEASAFSRWKNSRLPSEKEWENTYNFLANSHEKGIFVEDSQFHPISNLSFKKAHEKKSKTIYFMLGGVWEITSSDYGLYPGYSYKKNALEEYNSKFMSNQKVMRGGSVFSSKRHIRPTYRNYLYANQYWLCSGIRLAR